MRKLMMAIPLAGALIVATTAMADDTCSYEGRDYSHGAAVCQSGTQFRCEDGNWDNVGFACSENYTVISKSCELDGSAFSAGATSCQAGMQYRCDNGAWSNLGVACIRAGDEPIRLAPVGRTCMIDGATVANRSTICRAGDTHLCDDGIWQNIGTPCR